jgi:hypothetical protein
MFTNQKLITLSIALLCFLQLAVVSIREFANELKEPGSKLYYTAKETLNSLNRSLSMRRSATVTGSVALQQDDTTTRNKQTATIKEASKAIPSGSTSSAALMVPQLRGISAHTESGAHTESRGVGRDPFVPFFKVHSEQSASAKGELTSYELDQLRVTAVIRASVEEVSASLESRDGRSFIVRPGTKIGLRGGTVEEITNAGVVVVREVGGIDGVTVVRRELGIR